MTSNTKCISDKDEHDWEKFEKIWYKCRKCGMEEHTTG